MLQARAELQTVKHFWTCFVAYYSDLFLPLTQFQVYLNHLDPYMLSSNGNTFLCSGDQNWWIRTAVIQNPPTWFSPVSRWHFIFVVFFFFLVFMVVMHLKDNLIPGEFLMAIRFRPVALSLHIKVSLWEKSCVNECVFVQGSNQDKTCCKVLQRNANIAFARKRFSFYAFTL